MKYNVDLERECDLTQISIAAAEMNSVLALIEHSRNNEVDFYRYVAYAKELQGGLRKMEVALKTNNLTEQEKDYLTNILKAEIELNNHTWPSDAEEMNDNIQSIMNKLNINNKNNERT